MRQFILPAGWDGSADLRLTGDEHHYISRVLRYAAGTVFPGRDPAGRLFSLTVAAVEKDYTLLKAVPAPAGEETAPATILYTSLLKGKNSDLVIRQATEAGVSKIQPITSRNSVVRPGETGGRLERWKKIAREAAQQCGNPGVPEILPPASLEALDLTPFSKKNSPEGSFGFFFHEKPLENKPLHEYLYGIHGPVSLFFGPEGGFSPEEAERFRSFGVEPVYLGGNVLRAETAVVYGIGAVLTILREHNSWHLRKKN